MSRPRGSEHYEAKLTEERVIEAIDALAAGESCGSIGRRMGVDPTVIIRIKNGTAWKHVPRPESQMGIVLEVQRRAALRRVRALRKRLARAEAELLLVQHQIESRKEAA